MKDITSLPPAIARHVAAYNDHDPDALLTTLSPDALLNDVQREFLGHEAIRAWAAKEIFAPKVTLALIDAVEHYGEVTARFAVDGEFDKTNLPDPLVLTYYFTVRDSQIVRLIILHNKPAA